MLIWVFDDGHISRDLLNYDCIRITIATCGFQRKEIEEAVNILNLNFGFNLTITRRNEIYFKKADAIKFCKMALPFIPDGLEYKSNLIKGIAKDYS